MMIEALLASIAIALLSLSGVFVFGRRGKIEGAHQFILPVAVGVFLGVVFFELIPETLAGSPEWGAAVIAAGFFMFYLLSHLLDTFHHHHHPGTEDHCVSGGAQKLLIGDAIHNVADGIVIASAFLIHPAVGAATAVGVALHEIPQEIAEFGVLVASGYSKKRAALLNLLSASSIIIGVLLVAIFSATIAESLFILTGLAAGNLLYIATADLIPELRHSHHEHFWQAFLSTIIGFLLIGTLLHYLHHTFNESHEYDEISHSTEHH